MDRNGRNREQIINDPVHIIAYPRWSPTGDNIAYIRMPDSNVPFTVGELVLADGNGRNERVIAPADAGHGYPPVWSPDGRQVAFVVRENERERCRRRCVVPGEQHLSGRCGNRGCAGGDAV